MGGQEENYAFDASPQPRVLTPSSESSLDQNDAVGSRKRKREKDAMEELLDDIFVVKPYPSTVFSKPYTLRTVALIPRSDIPLSFLDLSSPLGVLPISRVFEANIKILELERRMRNTPMVLVARSEDGRTHYAVERESRNLFVLCKLGSWVKIDRLCASAVVSRLEIPRRTAISNGLELGVQMNSSEGQVMLEASKYSKKKRLAIEAIQLMVKRPTKALEHTCQDKEVPICILETAPGLLSELHRSEKIVQDDVIDRATAKEILDNIRIQYFETLYLSKASLAYFAKGPLSRARAAFHLDYDSTLEMRDLIGFLEGLILPINTIDKKYRDGIPSLVSNLDVEDGSGDEARKLAIKTKKGKPKKLKPGKNGLYPAEETYIRQWWTSDDNQAELDGVAGSRGDALQKRIRQLRIRETQLQMIVILETLALHPLATPETNGNGELPLLDKNGAVSDGKAISGEKSKKALALPVLVEMHVDRLCIWQSVAAEQGRNLPGVGENQVAGASSVGLGSTREHAADMLREFCVEVVVPFFSARLPEQCGSISRKLGGPVVPSPDRPRLAKIVNSSTGKTRPGAITKRPVLPKARRSLQRALTDERSARGGSRGPSGAISLMRSATDSVIPGIKREGSETPLLTAIPSIESQSILVSRGGVLKSKKFSQREVDLSSLVTGTDAKTKKASIEAELRDAILALKRPNRQLAGQLLVETAEKRTASTTTYVRKSKKPIRNPSFQGIQILSTPKGNRWKEVAFDRQSPQALHPEGEVGLESFPHSSIPRVPLSAVRPANQNSQVFNTTPARPRQSNMGTPAIEVTPCRGRAMFESRSSGILAAASSQTYSLVPPTSPLQSRYAGKQQLLGDALPRGQRMELTSSDLVTIQATPVKAGNDSSFTSDDFLNTSIYKADHAEKQESDEIIDVGRSSARAGNDVSIYKSLGWDDYDDFT